MKRRGLALIPIIAICVVAFLLAGGCTKHKPEGKAKVRIAINVPLTGPIAGWSGQFANGFRMGIDDASHEYGLNPKTFDLDIQDNAGQPSQAVSIFHKQKIKGFDVYVSVATGPANAVAPELDKMGVPHFIAAFDPFITQLGSSRFRVMANSKIEAPLFIKYAIAHHAKSVFVIQLDMSYAEDEFGKIVQPALEKAGIKVHRELFELPDRNFKTIVEKAKAANPDLIYLCGYSFHLQPLIKDLRAAGLIQNGKVVTTMDFVDLVNNGTPTSELRDVVFVCPNFDIPGKVAKAAEWRKRYEERFKVKPTYVPAYAYDNAALIVRAYAKSKKVDTASLMAAVPFNGVNGKINLDKDRDIMATVSLAEIGQNGEIDELKQ